MRSLVRRVARSIRQGRLLRAGDRVAVAVSGGADSVALAWLMRELGPEADAELAGLIHVNHSLRGAESDADEAFSVALAERIGVPVEVVHVDVEAIRRARRCSLEVAARQARYRAFDAAAARLGATVVATGHTRDDQAETVLLRLLRGAGTRGLSGIRARRGRFVRPLLDAGRADLRAYLQARGETWREDASNLDREIPRNRLRADVMPAIAAFAPSAVGALARLAALAADDEASLSSLAEAARNDVVRTASKEDSGSVGVELDGVALGRLAPAVARRLVRSVVADLRPGATIGARHLEAVCRLAATDKPVGHLDLPGLAIDRQGGRLTLRVVAGGRAVAPPERFWPERVLPIPGEVALPEAGVTIVVREATGSDVEVARALEGGSSVALVRRAALQGPLRVRNRRPGDRFQPLGAPGHRKVQDVLVDRKVPRAARQNVPVVIDADGRIVWVAGVAVAEPCRIGSPEEGVLILEQRTAR